MRSTERIRRLVPNFVDMGETVPNLENSSGLPIVLLGKRIKKQTAPVFN